MLAESAMSGPYVIDSSSFMDWQGRYYPTDVFEGLVTRFDALLGEERLLAPAIVKEELESVGTDELKAWAKARPGIFVKTSDVLAEARATQARFPRLTDPKALYEEADAYVVALARMRDGLVITQETPAAEKRNPKRTHFIPDVCRELGIPCINLIGLMRREKWNLR